LPNVASMRVLVTSPFFGRYSTAAEERLESAGCVLRRLESATDEQLIDAVAESDAWIVGLQRATERVLEAGRALRLVCVHGVGVDHVDVKSATRLGIVVTNTPATNAAAVAELTMGLILALARDVVRSDHVVRTGGWELPVGHEVSGKTLGIIGYGHIGRRVAVLARCLGMAVLVHSKHVEIAGDQEEEMVRFMPLEALLREADYVSVHTALREETRGLIGERELRLMKPTACLVNTARGGIVDEGALAAALQANRLRGAAVDVFSSEPPTDGRLIACPSVIATPHLGGNTVEAFRRTSDAVADNLAAVLQGRPPVGFVNPEVWSRYTARWP
jgi:D-3-phosphoglycerate dehydrogenase / 2-oxoglutarate reductase